MKPISWNSLENSKGYLEQFWNLGKIYGEVCLGVNMSLSGFIVFAKDKWELFTFVCLKGL